MPRSAFLWNAENVRLPELDYPFLEKWISNVAAGFDKRCGKLGYCFCDDEKIIDVNREFLQHDYFTDIITFDYSHGRIISGDMYISLDTVRSNAKDLCLPYTTELLRVIIHGILHLCGIDDKGKGEREIMEQFENQSLELYKQLKSAEMQQDRENEV